MWNRGIGTAKLQLENHGRYVLEVGDTKKRVCHIFEVAANSRIQATPFPRWHFAPQAHPWWVSSAQDQASTDYTRKETRGRGFITITRRCDDE